MVYLHWIWFVVILVGALIVGIFLGVFGLAYVVGNPWRKDGN